MLHHCGEQHQNFRVTRLWVGALEVIDQELQGDEELLGEDSVLLVCFLRNVDLNELQNVPAHCLHGFAKVV